MNIALVLSGGTGGRMGAQTPKQYCLLAGKPVIVHTIETLQQCSGVAHVLVVADPKWEDAIFQWRERYQLDKLCTVAPAGENRQRSIRNGLLAAQQLPTSERDGVIVQDAARPLTSVALLERLIAGLQEAPCVMPVLPVTDTVYQSESGQWVDGLLPRASLYAGQAPEAFHCRAYTELYRDTPVQVLDTMSGSCQLPHSAGWKVKMIPGEQENIKITYPRDMEFCEYLLRKREMG